MSLTAMARLTGSQDTNQIRLSDQSLCSQQVILTHKAHGPRPLRPLESVNNLRQVKVAHDRRRPATIHLSAKNTTGARAITPVNKTKIVSSLSSPKNQPSAIIKSTESQSLSGQSLRGKLQAAGNCKPSGLRRFIPPSPASLPRSSSRLSKALPENGSMITNARRSLEVSNPPDRRSISPGSNTLSSSLQSNSTVRPSRAASSARGSLDMMETSSKIKAKERAPTAISDNAVSAVRSKRLSSMKGKNERILASINAHLSPPTSPPNSHQISEPPLPSPPSSSSSRETCHSSSSTSPIRTVPVTISQPSAPLHISTPESEGTESFSESRSLSVPGSINGRPSGLIPFAAGCSPSPRKISVDPQGLSDPLNAEPKAQLDVTGFEDEDAEDARLGSVRGKRAERTRLLKRLSPAVEANSCETVSKGIIGLEEKIDQGVDRGERLKYQISEIVSHEESIVKTNVQRSEADRSLLGTRSGQVRAHDKRDPIVREASRMSACPEDGEEHALRAQALRTWQKSHAVIDGHLHQRRDSIDRQTQISIMSDEEHESFSEGSAGHHQRLGSGSTSRHTSSSDTIGKTDFPTRELDSDLIEKDFLPIDQDHQHSSRWAEEEEDMPTPVKAHAGRLRALRHTSSTEHQLGQAPNSRRAFVEHPL
ncbi:hypothetical protein BY996DRAFT_3525997 [Phakopsora pachyrhizi]|nr:hypothetical protein BY996DRAFT_3525997 [Phakopsora pachyrhizi]